MKAFVVSAEPCGCVLCRSETIVGIKREQQGKRYTSEAVSEMRNKSQSPSSCKGGLERGLVLKDGPGYHVDLYL